MADSEIERLRDSIDHAWDEARNFGLRSISYTLRISACNHNVRICFV